MSLAAAGGPPDWWYLGMGLMAVGWATVAGRRWWRRYGRSGSRPGRRD